VDEMLAGVMNYSLFPQKTAGNLQGNKEVCFLQQIPGYLLPICRVPTFPLGLVAGT